MLTRADYLFLASAGARLDKMAQDYPLRTAYLADARSTMGFTKRHAAPRHASHIERGATIFILYILFAWPRVKRVALSGRHTLLLPRTRRAAHFARGMTARDSLVTAII